MDHSTDEFLDVDASATKESGSMHAKNIVWLGSYDMCRDIAPHRLNSTSFAGRYCLSTFTLSGWNNTVIWHKIRSPRNQQRSQISSKILELLDLDRHIYLPDFQRLPVRYGLCLPDSCSDADVGQL